MSSLLADRIVSEALEHGLAILKIASPNDLGITGAHQRGFYIANAAATYLTPQAPVVGINHDHPITIEWTDGTITNSTVKWYGRRKREYRITSFNRIHNFWPLSPERLGGVLILIKRARDDWLGHLLDDADDIDDVCAALGVTLDDATWTVFLGAQAAKRDRGALTDCEAESLRQAVQSVPMGQFPSTAWMSHTARTIVDECRSDSSNVADTKLVWYLGVEFELFKALESRETLDRVREGFETVDDFIVAANSLLQRRKARAGKSLESHLEAVLDGAGVSFEAQPLLDGTRPDFVMPSTRAYDSADGGSSDVFVVAVKTTCKDRWRQVTKEGPKAATKYLVTLQHGISSSQMREMEDAGVRLVVPADRHEEFAKADRAALLTIEDFLALLPKRDENVVPAASLF